MRTRLMRFVRQPLDDYVAALAVFVPGWDWPRLALLVGTVLISWWVYVPLHELAHAYGCLLGGGTVSRLDIDPIYGAAVLQRVFPFVHVGSDYAGQLRGFDTHGNDLTYLLTDFLPFVATIIVGVPLLRAAAQLRLRPAVQAILFGASLPVAFAPFVSLTGDYYEMGSIVVSRATVALAPDVSLTRWRSDDLFKLVTQLFGPEGTGDAGDGVGLAASLLVGVALALLTYAAGSACAERMLGATRARVRRA